MTQQSLWGKARNLVLSNVHNLLDRAIDQNKVESVKQYLRDLGEARDQIADEVAVATGRVENTKREIGKSTALIEEFNSNIDLLLNDGDESNDKDAGILETRLLQEEENLSLLTDELATHESMKTEMAAALSKVEARYNDMGRKVRQLEMMERTAKAQDQASSALAGVADSASSAPNIDSVSARIEEQSAISRARFARAVGGVVDSATDSVTEAKVAARLAERKKRLAGGGS